VFVHLGGGYKRKRENENFIFFLGVMEAQVDESGGRMLLGDNTGGSIVKRLPIRFHCVGVWISSGLPCTNKYI